LIPRDPWLFAAVALPYQVYRQTGRRCGSRAVSGGLICIAGAGLIQLLLPALSRYQRPAALTAST